MLVKTNLIPKGFQAFTCWPFIFIKPNCVNDLGLIRHEMVHYKEQGLLSIPWLIRYFLSKDFRLKAEVRAYKEQIEYGGISVAAAASMLTRYKLGISLIDAYILLEEKEKV